MVVRRVGIGDKQKLRPTRIHARVRAAVGNQDFQKAACTSCGGKIEFPATAQGMTVECPHCHAQTELRPAQAARRNISRLLIFGVIGTVLAIGALMFLKPRRTESARPESSKTTNAAVSPAEPPRPKALEDLKLLGTVAVEKAKGSRLSYAMGTLKNDSDHPRYGVKVEVELFDSGGNKLTATANDYMQMLEPGKEWKFRAMVLDSKAVSAKVASVKEE